MGWSRIHSIAVETELWLSLTVNLWVILTGIAFATLKVVRRADPDGRLLLEAARWGLRALGFVVGSISAFAIAATLFWLLSWFLQAFFDINVWHWLETHQDSN